MFYSMDRDRPIDFNMEIHGTLKLKKIENVRKGFILFTLHFYTLVTEIKKK